MDIYDCVLRFVLAHVFFDDAFYHDENQQRTLNMFVKDFFEAINKAAG